MVNGMKDMVPLLVFLNIVSLSTRFVAALNKKMRYAYCDQYFVELLGKPLEQLWS